MAITKAKICTITSVKGGTGKTTLTLNLAGIFSNKNKKVLILDFDLYTGSIAAMLNIEVTNDIYNLYEDLNNNRFDSIDNYIVKYSDNISIIASPKDPRVGNKITSDFLGLIIKKVVFQYDYILIDTNHCLNDINLVSYDFSDKIIYVINNDMMNLKNMRTMNSILTGMDKDNYLVVLNNSIDRNRGYFGDYDIKSIIKHNVDYVIPSNFYIKSIDKYIMDGEILTLNRNVLSHYKKAIDKFEMIAENISKCEYKGDN